MKISFNFSASGIIKKVLFILFIISIMIKIQADLFFYENSFYPSWSVVRHIMFVVIICLAFLIYIGVSNRGKWSKPAAVATVIYLLFLGASVVMAINANQPFNRALEVTFMSLSPIILTYFFVNIYSKKEINSFMRTTFIFLTIQYIFSKYDVLISFDSWLQIDFFQSFSPFESSAMSGYFYGFLIYFTLFDYNRFFVITSFVLNFLVFKRVNVLFSIILVLLGNKNFSDKKISISTKWFLIIAFTLLPILEYYMLTGAGINKILEIFPKFDMQGLLMGRNWFLSTVLNNGYKSYGLGSFGTELYNLLMRMGLELDGVQMYLELGILGVFGTSYMWWNFTERNLKNVIIVFLFMLNYLTSAQLGDSFAVFFNTLTMAMISNYGNYKDQPSISNI